MTSSVPEIILGFEKKNKLSFKNKDLLLQALTHSSFAKRKGLSKSLPYNERLEFFGDAVLKLIVSDYLFKKFPNYQEGKLTTIRAYIISDSVLAQLAQQINIGSYLRLSYGEKNSGGATRKSILANAFEAFLGAYFLDQGLETTQTFLQNLLRKNESSLQLFETRDYKTKLQEFLQKKKEALPTYQLCKEIGKKHDVTFQVKLSIKIGSETQHATGLGRSKKEAEQDAAKTILTQLSLL